MLSFPCSFGLILFAKYFIKLLFGEDYLLSAYPLYVLAFLIFPIVFVGIFLSFFSAKEKPKIFAKLIIISVGLNILLNLIFIKFLLLISPSWAMIGVGMATFLSWTFYFFAALLISKRRFKMKISLKPTIKPIISSIIMWGILTLVLRLINELSLISGALIIFFGASIYLLSMFFLKAITKEDLELIKILIKRKKH